jgi:type IV secretory pathway protease TraF
MCAGPCCSRSRVSILGRIRASLPAEEPLAVKVLFQALPDVQVSAFYAGAKLKGHSYPVSSRTDPEGRAVLKLDRAGLWYARLIYMRPAQDAPEVDWRSYFATLNFEVLSGRTIPSSE